MEIPGKPFIRSSQAPPNPGESISKLFVNFGIRVIIQVDCTIVRLEIAGERQKREVINLKLAIKLSFIMKIVENSTHVVFVILEICWIARFILMQVVEPASRRKHDECIY